MLEREALSSLDQEVAAEIETIGLTKPEFKEFLEGLRLYKELKFIKYWTYQKLKDDLWLIKLSALQCVFNNQLENLCILF